MPNHLEFHSAGEILRCPWHGFEFCLKSGAPTVADSDAMPMRLRFYTTEVDGDDVVVVT
jgi:nitrite reductase/ring-hydroxylating ferredoxin subunit